MRPTVGVLITTLEPSAPRPQPANHQTALRHRIDPTIQPLEKALQQGAAAQALGLADGRHRHVDGLARLGKRRQIRMNGHRRHVLDLRLDVVRHLDAEIVQHGAKGLLGEGVALLTRARQTDHQTVADQLVATYPSTELMS